MPNWCDNYLQIETKTAKQFTKVIQGITNNSDQPFDFNRIIPTPQELLDCGAPNKENPQEMKDKYGYADWYDFRCSKWGTKWNACDVNLELNSPTSLSISFNTAWSPPIPVIEAIAEKYPFASISLEYYEEGNGFYGTCEWAKGTLQSSTEGETNCEWRIERWGECNCGDCGVCDCECGCEQSTAQTICSDCNENDHQNNNNLPQFTNKEERKEINA